MSLAEARAVLTAPGAPFEMEEVEIRGVATRVWKNTPSTLAVLTNQARMHGDRLFIICEEERVSYEAHFRAAARLAHWLIGNGVAKGDRVAIAMRNLPEWPVIFFATTTIGAIAVPLNAWWSGQELSACMADCGASLLFCDVERHQRIAPHIGELAQLRRLVVARTAGIVPGSALVLEDIIGSPGGYERLPPGSLPDAVISSDDDATIFYTSGTTGTAKGAVGTHRNILTNIHSTAYAAARNFLRRGQPLPEPAPRVRLVAVPLFHATACSASMITGMPAGNTNIFMRKWDAGEALRIIERERVNITGGVPTIAWQLLEHVDRASHDISSLESLAYGGAPSAPELVRRIASELDAMPGNGWGMTETTATVTAHSAEDYLARPDSCGPPVPVADLKIVVPDGEAELPVGEVGELWARGPMVVKGYWNRPEATAATFVDRWVRTGDLARLDHEGFCYIVDRSKDVIIRGGENIYSIEVENALFDHPAVIDAALIGLPHHSLGEEPAAVVQLARGARATEADLQGWVRARLAAFKVPVRIVFAQTLPRNASGKIVKGDLRPLFQHKGPQAKGDA